MNAPAQRREAQLAGESPAGASVLDGLQRWPSSNELREAAIADLVSDVWNLMEALKHVAPAIHETDERLTATLVAARDTTDRLAEIVGHSEAAFKGELAVRASRLARREAVDALQAELTKLQQLITFPRPAPTPWRTILLTAALSSGLSILGFGLLSAALHH
ncbi:hypothetical protein QDD76_004962 [Burkholderia cepacia]|jgi:hypothetical protein|uniref:DUF883 domain-containing protein n=1 Tax=Burkholderia contaminans TaxID=488447 RepID=A0ABD7YG20_9BURK|nr:MULTISPECIES: hypothetical protein [Burkholderia]EKS9798969.1 hypothetical protein [Burkholderia cepacia]EKS9805923.1 hypothetical protein [Burkholderia cepacia]EKS9813471.1 hypothetical protein [Burkholderia cepacia]EKS9820310.1 hypothetical protein [Burkholderia cepacia]EKS9828175.1 hypothetical protein [Burkholderia cepacia]